MHRILTTEIEFAEARLEAEGYIFHGRLGRAKSKAQAKTTNDSDANAKPNANTGSTGSRATSNQVHFPHCAKLERVPEEQTKIWFPTIRAAKEYLDVHAGTRRWKWCKICQAQITQRILDREEQLEPAGS